METVDELRRRVEDISSAIKHHRQVLVDLEKERSVIQNELNCILDPMTRLPLEISSDILFRCLPTPAQSAPLQAPAIFLSISHSWSSIALATPSLWAAINDDDVPAAKFSQLFASWLKRARNFPLSLSLRGSLDEHRALSTVEALLKQYAFQVWTLNIHLSSAKQLERITVPFTSLRSLTIGRDNSSTHFSYKARACADFLCAAPNLVECTFLGVTYAMKTSVLEKRTHFSLQHLRLGRSSSQDYGDFESSANILEYLTLPALQCLLISRLDIPYNNFLAFLTRSSPPLRSLQLKSLRAPESEMTIPYFRLVPSLRDLDMGNARVSAADLLNLLVAAEDLLPNLRNLTIRGVLTDIRDCSHILTVLAARRGTLQSFQLIVPPETVALENLASVLREVVKDERMQVHIRTDRTEEQNYLAGIPFDDDDI